MKLTKKIVAVAAVLGMLGTAGVVYAATNQTPAQILSGLTGKSVEDLYEERTNGKTFGTIAQEAGKLDEFKAKMLEEKKAALDQRVKDGQLTQEQADNIYKNIQSNQAACNGTGRDRMGSRNGAGFGQGRGAGCGLGAGAGWNK